MKSRSVRSTVSGPPDALASSSASVSFAAPARSSSPDRATVTPSRSSRAATLNSGDSISLPTLFVLAHLGQQQRDVVARRHPAEDLLDDVGAQRLEAGHAVRDRAQVLERVVDDLPGALDQPVGEEHEPVARREAEALLL